MTNQDRMLTAVKAKNWVDAHAAFARVMQEKVNHRLHQETRVIFESALPPEDVQRVFDETQNVAETEVLCGIKHLLVNSKGEVVSYRNLSEAYDDDESGTRNRMFADPGGNSALRAATRGNPRNLPCPTCKRPNMLTPKDKRQGYQCNQCADRDEGVGY